MNRRKFLRLSAAMMPVTCAPLVWAQSSSPEVAFTFDDPQIEEGAGLRWQEINARILKTLEKHKLKAMLFVCGKRVDSIEGRRLIAEWNGARHGIGNHTYSHHSLNSNGETGNSGPLAEFEADTLKNELVLRDYSRFVRLFRFPFLKEGDTIEKRDGMRTFLQQHGYRNGRATIDASDWAISNRMEAREKIDPKVDLTPYRDFFCQHIWERAQFYNSLTHRVLGHPVRHTVLLHHNSLNALFLNDLITMFGKQNWKTVDADWAYMDPVYDLQPNILPAGESLIWALAKQSGKFDKELRYPGEDDAYENPKMDALKL